MQRGADKPMSESPILIVPYMWIGDFVRCHTVVKLLKQRFPSAAVDILTTSMVAPLLDYMPGVRKGVVADLPRKRLALSDHRALAQRLRAERYGQALVMPRTWKSALAPLLAGIPSRTGFVGEGRFGLINDLRFGERRLPRMTDRCAMLALPKGAAAPPGASGWGLRPMDVPWLRSRRARSDPPSVGPRPPTPISRAGLLPRAIGYGWWADQAKKSLPPKSPPAPISATSPGPICVTRFLRSPRRRSQYRMTLVYCTSRLRSVHRPSESSVRLAHGTGLRSTRSPR